MQRTIDQCRRLHNAAPLARPTVWPYRPIPGTAMWDQAIELGYQPPTDIREWGSIGEYHLEETWPGKIPPHVAERRITPWSASRVAGMFSGRDSCKRNMSSNACVE